MVDVRCDAMRLGAAVLCRSLYGAGCKSFIVSDLDEAMVLRASLPVDTEIIILQGSAPGEELVSARNRLTPTLNSLEQLRDWWQAARTSRCDLPAVLQFDAGKSGHGFPTQDWEALAASLKYIDDIQVRSLILIQEQVLDDREHLDAEECLTSLFPYARFVRQISDEATGERRQSDDTGFLRIAQLVDVTAQTPHLSAVVRVEAVVIQIGYTPSSSAVDHSIARLGGRRLATLAGGYGDGLLQMIAGRAGVHFQSTWLPFTGSLGLGHAVIDVSELADTAIERGSVVEVVGQHQSLRDLADIANTTPEEMLLGLGDRFQRIYKI